MARPPIRQSVLTEEVRIGAPIIGASAHGLPIIPHGSRVLQTVTNQSTPVGVVHPLHSHATLPALSVMNGGHFPTTSIQTNQVVTRVASPVTPPAAVVEDQYEEHEEVIESRRSWKKMPRLMATSSRVAPPYQEQPSERTKCGGCPLWLLGLLTVLSLLGLIAGVLYARSALNHTEPVTCLSGEFLKANKCIKCDSQTYWNGDDCVAKVHPIAQPTTPHVPHGPHVNPPSPTTPTSINTTHNTTSSIAMENKTTEVEEKGNCENGFFMYEGHCIQCPSNSKWNGTSCVTQQQPKAKVSEDTTTSNTSTTITEQKRTIKQEKQKPEVVNNDTNGTTEEEKTVKKIETSTTEPEPDEEEDKTNKTTEAKSQTSQKEKSKGKAPGPAAETPKTPAVETPKAPEPAVETPKAPEPAAETPKTPAVETPKAPEPAAETPKTPAVETPKTPASSGNSNTISSSSSDGSTTSSDVANVPVDPTSSVSAIKPAEESTPALTSPLSASVVPVATTTASTNTATTKHHLRNIRLHE